MPNGPTFLFVVEKLKDEVARRERQTDVTHRVTLNLAAKHNQLIGDHHEAEWMIRNLKTQLGRRDAGKESLSAGIDAQGPAVNEDFGSAGKGPAAGPIN